MLVQIMTFWALGVICWPLVDLGPVGFIFEHLRYWALWGQHLEALKLKNHLCRRLKNPLIKPLNKNL